MYPYSCLYCPKLNKALKLFLLFWPSACFCCQPCQRQFPFYKRLGEPQSIGTILGSYYIILVFAFFALALFAWLRQKLRTYIRFHAFRFKKRCFPFAKVCKKNSCSSTRRRALVTLYFHNGFSLITVLLICLTTVKYKPIMTIANCLISFKQHNWQYFTQAMA